MGLVEAVVILVVGYLAGVVTRWVAGLVAVVALFLAVFGLATPDVFFGVAEPVFSVYAANELLFIAGFLFGIGHSRS